jgi:hypothetical protein
MALVMMAMLFMLKEREENRAEIPLLSCSNIETLPGKIPAQKRHELRRDRPTDGKTT